MKVSDSTGEKKFKMFPKSKALWKEVETALYSKEFEKALWEKLQVGPRCVFTTPLREEVEGCGTGLFSTSRSRAGSFCRSLYALALMFPPKLSSHTHTLQMSDKWKFRDFRVQTDTRGFAIGAHPDISKKLATMMFYLPTGSEVCPSSRLRALTSLTSETIPS